MRLKMLKMIQTEQSGHRVRKAGTWVLGGLAALSLLTLGASPANAGDEFERAFRYEFGGTLGRIAAHEAVGIGRGVLGEVLGVNHGHGHSGHGARYYSSYRGDSHHYGASHRYGRGYDRGYDRRHYGRGYDRGRHRGHYKHNKHRRYNRGHNRHYGGYRGRDCD